MLAGVSSLNIVSHLELWIVIFGFIARILTIKHPKAAAIFQPICALFDQWPAFLCCFGAETRRFGTTRSKNLVKHPATDYIQPTCARFYLETTGVRSLAYVSAGFGVSRSQDLGLFHGIITFKKTQRRSILSQLARAFIFK